jgi:biopolymer transport protein ExbB/TolQ
LIHPLEWLNVTGNEAVGIPILANRVRLSFIVRSKVRFPATLSRPALSYFSVAPHHFPNPLFMRKLSHSALIAFALTVVLYVLLRLLLSADAWFTVFLYERSLTQWLAIAMFLFGLDQLFARFRVARRETKKLPRVRWPEPLENDTPVAPIGWVERRLALISDIARHHSSVFTKNAAKELSDEDDRAFNENYVLTTDVVQLLPLVGFFGTVWGLSQGLYNNFVLQGEDSTSSFANAIGTAFDTTLLALFLTILLSIMQSVIRRSEQSVLEHLDQVIEKGLVQLETTGGKVLPASNDPRIWMHELGLDPAELIGFFRDKLGLIAGQLQNASATNEHVLATLKQLDTTLAASSANTQPAVDLAPQLTATAEALQALQQAQQEVVAMQQKSIDGQVESMQVQQEIAAALTRVDALLAEQIPTALGTLGRLDEGVRDHSSDAAVQSSNLLEQFAALETKLAAMQADTKADRSSLTEAVQSGAAHTATSLELLREQIATQQEMLNRPKSFTVTETPSSGDADSR